MQKIPVLKNRLYSTPLLFTPFSFIAKYTGSISRLHGYSDSKPKKSFHKKKEFLVSFDFPVAVLLMIQEFWTAWS